MNENDLARFASAQDADFPSALAEIQAGRKRSHWIWYIFPQMRGLGRRYNSQYYGIADRAEAEAYLQHPVYGPRLRQITQALLAHSDKSAVEILGGIDAQKVRSCMTLFDAIAPNDIFHQALQLFYGGQPCRLTLKMLGACR